MPDKDLEIRRVGQRVDQVSGEIYTKEMYDPEKPPKQVLAYIIFTCYLLLKFV